MQSAFFSTVPPHAGVATMAATTFLGSPVTAYSRSPRSQAGQAVLDVEDKYNAVQHEQSMWRAVIVQALMDAASTSQKAEALVWKREAITWLRGNSPDFYTVCFFAELDPDFVREVAASALKNGCVWRAAPGTGPMKFDPRRAKTKKPRKFTQKR